MTTARNISGNGHTPPQSLDAERALLLSVLYCPELAPLALSTVKPDDFYNPQLSTLWSDLQAYHAQTGNLDESNLSAWMQETGRLKAHGGRDAIGLLFFESAKRPMTNIDAEIDTVKRWSSKRRLWALSRTIQDKIDAGEEHAVVLAEVHRQVESLDGAQSGIDLSQCSASARLNDVSTFRPVTFYKTGFVDLDRALGGGLAAGEATSLFAPSGMGKSAFMCNLALNLTRGKTPAGILSLEMCEQDIWRLAVGILADIPRQHIRANTLTTVEKSRFGESMAMLAGWPLYVLDRRRFPQAPDMAAVADVVRDGAKRYGWRVVLLDYLAKVGPFDADELTRIPRLTAWIFDLAQRTGVHVVALAQSNKASFDRQDNKKQRRAIALQDSKGGVEVIADFDNCIGLIRDDWNTDEPKDPAPMSATVLKARQGSGGVAPLVFWKSTGRIVEGTRHV
ncbi:MAG TPA: DnaB-like helicase C-terminal domain-containing protein [Planctomycetota bacterium]|jgi:replicative DNA helicase